MDKIALFALCEGLPRNGGCLHREAQAISLIWPGYDHGAANCTSPRSPRPLDLIGDPRSEPASEKPAYPARRGGGDDDMHGLPFGWKPLRGIPPNQFGGLAPASALRHLRRIPRVEPRSGAPPKQIRRSAQRLTGPRNRPVSVTSTSGFCLDFNVSEILVLADFS